MDLQEQPSHNHQEIINRFTAACQADERVVAASLYGSNVRGAADAYSDLDLALITTDQAYEGFLAGREAFVRLLGEPLFMEDFDSPETLFLMFSDGTDTELSFGRESKFNHIQRGPYRVLVDKKNILAGAVFPEEEPTQAGQIEKLRRLVYWFWHDLAHFITAMGRGQLWWAYGQLEVLRLMCVNLARLRHDFSDPYVGEEAYFKLEKVLPVEQLASLQVTYCPMEQDAMLQAGLVIVHFYQELAPLLGQAHGITYPNALERVMLNRLEILSETRLS